jgi:sugar lactone lactonase YvrE
VSARLGTRAEEEAIVEGQNKARIVADGLVFGESPRWRDGMLWVSDWGANEVLRFDATARREVVDRVASFPMCIEHLPDGRLLIVDSAGKRLLRREQDGTLVQHADFRRLSGLDAFGNDIVVDGRGAIYVNDIGFKFPGGEFRPGVIALVAPDGAVRKVADDLAFPNGMAVTPDNRTLIVAESYGCRLTAFDISPDGGLSGRRVWAQVEDHPDGVCLDAGGCAWYADVGSKRCVRVREGGGILDTVELDRGAFACVLGGPGRKTLFIVCQDWRGPASWADGPRTGQVAAVPAPSPAAGWP